LGDGWFVVGVEGGVWAFFIRFSHFF